MDGSRVAYASGSVALEPPSRSLSDEWERKVRISAGSYQSLGRFASLLNPFRHGVVSVQFLFRKVFRWVLCPPALLMVLPAAFFTVKAGHEPRWFFLSALLCWGIFAVLTGLGWMLYGTAFGRKKVFQLPFYFTFMHAATLAGMIRHLLGGQSVVWRKAVR
jgi:hypothetical protein